MDLIGAVNTLKARRATASDLDEVTSIAHYYFDSVALGGIRRRKSYFAQIVSRNCRTIWVLQAERQIEGIVQDVVAGYSAVIPEKECISKAHVMGQFDQYTLVSDDILATEDVSGTHEPLIFAQAIAVNPLFSKNHAVCSAVKRMFEINVADVVTQYRSSSWSLFAEEFSEKGRQFMVERGFLPTGMLSPGTHPLHLLESYRSDLPLHGKNMVEFINWCSKDDESLTDAAIAAKFRHRDYTQQTPPP